MSRHCLICSSPDKTRTAQEMVSAGATDQAVGDRVGVSRAAAERHRKNHLRPVVQALAQGAQKDAAVRQQRQEIVAAAAKGEPVAPADILSISSLVSGFRKALNRIEKASDQAEAAGQLTALSGLLQQMHRNLEGRAKLAGHGGFAASKTQIGIGIGGKPFEPFVLRLNIGEKSQTMIMAPMDAPPFEVQYTDGRAFDPKDVKTNELVFVPRGHNAPVVEHQPIEQPAPAPDGGEQVDSDMDIDSLLSSVFDAKADEPENEVEPAPAPRRGRPRRA